MCPGTSTPEGVRSCYVPQAPQPRSWTLQSRFIIPEERRGNLVDGPPWVGSIGAGGSPPEAERPGPGGQAGAAGGGPTRPGPAPGGGRPGPVAGQRPGEANEADRNPGDGFPGILRGPRIIRAVDGTAMHALVDALFQAVQGLRRLNGHELRQAQETGPTSAMAPLWAAGRVCRTVTTFPSASTARTSTTCTIVSPPDRRRLSAPRQGSRRGRQRANEAQNGPQSAKGPPSGSRGRVGAFVRAGGRLACACEVRRRAGRTGRAFVRLRRAPTDPLSPGRSRGEGWHPFTLSAPVPIRAGSATPAPTRSASRLGLVSRPGARRSSPDPDAPRSAPSPTRAIRRGL
jgi:hypothetical protein